MPEQKPVPQESTAVGRELTIGKVASLSDMLGRDEAIAYLDARNPAVVSKRIRTTRRILSVQP